MNALSKNILIIVCGSVISLALAFWLVRPGLSNISTLNHQLLDRKAQLINLQQQILADQTAQVDLARASEKDRVYSTILAKEDLATAVIGIETAAHKTNTAEDMDIKDPFNLPAPVVANPPDKNANQPLIRGLVGIKEVPYQLSTTGGYLDFVNFLSYLEHLPNFTEISKIDISSESVSSAGSKPGHTGRVLGTVNGILFVKK